MKWWWGPLSLFSIVLAHWNNSQRVDMLLHSDTLFWFQANQSLLFLLNKCFVEMQQIPILLSLLWPNPDSNPQSTTLGTSMPTITPPMLFTTLSGGVLCDTLHHVECPSFRPFPDNYNMYLKINSKLVLRFTREQVQIWVKWIIGSRVMALRRLKIWIIWWGIIKCSMRCLIF